MRKVSPPNLPPPDFFIPLGALVFWVRRGHRFTPFTTADILSGKLPEELNLLKESAAKAVGSPKTSDAGTPRAAAETAAPGSEKTEAKEKEPPPAAAASEGVAAAEGGREEPHSGAGASVEGVGGGSGMRWAEAVEAEEENGGGGALPLVVETGAVSQEGEGSSAGLAAEMARLAVSNALAGQEG